VQLREGSTQSSASPESLGALLGGRKAGVDATLPPIAFIVTWLLTSRSIGWAALAAVVVGVVVAAYRLSRGDKPRAVLIGLLGVAVASIIVTLTGRAADFFLVQLTANAASTLAWAVSIVIRWPLLGVIVGALLGQKTRWRKDRSLVRAYSTASWVWVAQYALRVVVFGALYLYDYLYSSDAAVVALGVARVAMSWPLVAACIAVSGVVLLRSLPKDHPGFRHPRLPEDT
jgi:hypothetical protein